VVNLNESASSAKARPKREKRFALVREIWRDESIAMRLIAEVEKQLDIPFTADTTIHVQHLT
jgi:hypothetical protein